MRWKNLLLLVLVGCVFGCDTGPKFSTTASLSAVQERAGRYKSLITVPLIETTPNQIRAPLTNSIAKGNAALDRVGALSFWYRRQN